MSRRSGSGRVRRSGDSRARPELFRGLIGWVFAQWEPVPGGRLLLLAAGVLTTVTAPLLDPGGRAWEVLAGVSAVMTVVLLVSFAPPWSRLPGIATAAFPILVWLAVAALGVGAHGLGANFTGLFYLCFAYLGLTQPTRTIVALTPVAAGCYIGAYGAWTRPLAARVLIAMMAGLLLAVLIAELVRRQNVLVGKLRHAASTDELTGLPNRRDLDYRMALTGAGDTVVILDLDHFKVLNDTHGHAAGDRVLAEFGLILQTCLRHDDYAARYGGEEFALILPATDAAQASAALQRLRQNWHVSHPDVTFSAGTATFHPDRPPEQTLTAADHALYAAKAAGRNRDIAEQPPPPLTLFRQRTNDPSTASHTDRGPKRGPARARKP